jgi:hypothetical protein
LRCIGAISSGRDVHRHEGLRGFDLVIDGHGGSAARLLAERLQDVLQAVVMLLRGSD